MHVELFLQIKNGKLISHVSFWQLTPGNHLLCIVLLVTTNFQLI